LCFVSISKPGLWLKSSGGGVVGIVFNNWCDSPKNGLETQTYFSRLVRTIWVMPLMMAAESRHEAIVKLLIEKGVDSNSKD
jgi:hypothetical protein